jgi:hypothetical protein
LEMQEILDLLCYLSRFATTNHWHIGKTEWPYYSNRANTTKESEITGQSYIFTPEPYILGYRGSEVVSIGEIFLLPERLHEWSRMLQRCAHLSEVLSTSKEGTGLTAVQLDAS